MSVSQKQKLRGSGKMDKTIYIDKESVLDNEYSLSEIEEVILSQKVKYLGNRAFFHCTKLKNVVFEGEAIEMGCECFSACKSLKRIKLPKMSHIPFRCFFGASLEEIVFPDNLIVIDAYAFGLCKFKILDFPESLKSIGSYAFMCGGHLKTIDFKNVEHLGDGAFQQFTIEEFKIGRTIELIPCRCFDRSNIKNVEILETIPRGAPYEYCRHIVELDHFSFCQNPDMTIKLPNMVNYKDTSLFVTDHPYFLVYIKEPYKNMKILLPEEYGTDRYRVFDGHVVPVIKYKTARKEKKDETI